VVHSTTHTAENYQLCAWIPLRHTKPPYPGQLTYQIHTNAAVFKESKWRLHIPLITHCTQARDGHNCYYLEITATTKMRGYSEYVRFISHSRCVGPWSHASRMADKSATMTWTVYPTAAKDVNHNNDLQRLTKTIHPEFYYNFILFARSWTSLNWNSYHALHKALYSHSLHTIILTFFSDTTIHTLRSTLFWDTTQRTVAIPYWRFGPIFKGQEIRHHTLRNVPHERRTHLHRGG